VPFAKPDPVAAGDALPRLSATGLPDMDGPQEPMRTPPTNHWRRGEVALQGYFGASFDEVSRQGGSTGDYHNNDTTFPTLGGGAQWKLAGESVDIGLEGLMGIGWRGNVEGFVAGGGGAAVAVSVDLFLLELYGGPFASVTLGDGMRLYAGAGPMMEWAFYDQSSVNPLASGSGDGFGVGWYARTGIEFNVSRGSMVGLGVRWSQVTMDMSGGLGDLEVDGFLVMLTLSQGF